MPIWKIHNKKADFGTMRDKLGLDPITIRLLVNRGITDVETAKEFLYPNRDGLRSPFFFRGMEKACEIVKASIHKKERIRIIGDYDVDGICSTYILLDALKKMGAVVDYRIPERERDGYGLNERLIKEAEKDGISLLLTCDNGISCKDEIALAYELGLRVIVTDHHDIPPQLPNCEVILNPKLPECAYPFRELCGAAVAFKMVVALGAKEDDYLGFAAMATICDIVTLQGENRTIVSLGLPLLRGSTHIGLRALADANQIALEGLSVGQIGFRIGPCINACGRLDTANLAMELMLTSDTERAKTIAFQICKINDERKHQTEVATKQAIELIEATERIDTVLVLFLPQCHESIAGIVAGRIRELYHRPTLVLTHGVDCVKGSGRSTEYFNMIEALCGCSELFLHFGGHPMAAGFSLVEENIEPLRRFLNEKVVATEEDLQGKLLIDLMVPLSYVSEERVHEIALLEPYGQGNPAPIFGAKNVVVKGLRRIGRERNFMKLSLEDDGREIEALYFGDYDKITEDMKTAFGDETFQRLFYKSNESATMSILYTMDINEYNGVKKPQILLSDYRFT